MANQGKSGVVADILATAEREGEFLSHAQEATTALIQQNMPRIRGLAMLQQTHRVTFTLEYSFDFTPERESVDTRILLTATAQDTVNRPL